MTFESTLAVFGIAHYRGQHAGTGLFGLILLTSMIRVIRGRCVPAGVVRRGQKPTLPFVDWYLGLCGLLAAYWSVLRWSHVLLGASVEELRESSDMFSFPLGLLHPAFLIGRDKWSSDVIGIICGNAFFYALLTFVLYRAVHSRLNRNREIRLNITDSDPRNDP
jgi:hypothetical protein